MLASFLIPLGCLSLLFFAINDVEAALSDLDNIKPTYPIRPEIKSSETNSIDPKLIRELEMNQNQI